MNIAMVFDGLQIGGIERVGSDYARILKELGHSVTVINLVPHLTQMESEFPEGIRIERVSFPRKLCPEQYAQLVKKNTIGRVLYPVASGVLGVVDNVYKVTSRRYPFLREKYDLAIAFSGHFNDLTFITNNFINAKSRMCWLHGALYGYLLTSDGFYNLYKRIRNLVVLVDDAQEEALIYNHQTTFNIRKLYNPSYISNRVVVRTVVDTLRKEYGDFLLMVSRFKYPHKDHYTVIDALEVLHRDYGLKQHLVFIGDGPDEERVKEYTKRKSISSYVHFLGAKSDVQNYYSAAKLLVHASVAGEGLPTVMIEALSYNLPMVVTDSKVGPREILGNDDFGLLCKVQNPRDMAKRINQLLKDDDLYRKYQDLSPVRLKDFCPETIKKKLEIILEDVTAQN